MYSTNIREHFSCEEPVQIHISFCNFSWNEGVELVILGSTVECFTRITSLCSYIFLVLLDQEFYVVKTVLSSGYILILLSIEYILASLIKTCQE